MRKFIFDSITVVNEYHNSLHRIWELAINYLKNEQILYSDILMEIRNTIDLNKNTDDSQGHSTLLLLEQHTDRLVAMESTASQLYCDTTNRDVNDRPFYQLFRAEQIDNTDYSNLEQRGLTGWVFTSNQSLLINNIKSYKSENITEKKPISDAHPLPPIWGHTVSEFTVFSKDIDWNAHYIATPIKISEVAIGVLRYTCTKRKNSFGADELNYLKASSEIISYALQNRSYLQNRDAKLRLDNFESGDDINTNVEKFLNILQDAFNTSIISLYVYDDERRQLVMSYEKGIRLSREEMSEIFYDGEKKSGITWLIYKDNTVIDSSNIKAHKLWKGAFQTRYYHNAPRWADIINIPFLGGPICNQRGEPIGVLKLELPTASSGLSTFTREDVEFFKKEVLPIASRLIQKISNQC